MKNDVIISKMLGDVEKILKYSANMSYEDFVKNDMVGLSGKSESSFCIHRMLIFVVKKAYVEKLHL